MKMNLLNVSIAAIGAAAASYFGAVSVPLLVLLIVMILDYSTGMAKAYVKAELSSRIGIRGILKKLGYVIMVAVGVVVDYLLRYALTAAGLDLHFEIFFGMLITIWLIVNELISILENLAAIGVPVFPAVAKIINHIKGTIEVVADPETEKDKKVK